jgi:hypothetical protein
MHDDQLAALRRARDPPLPAPPGGGGFAPPPPYGAPGQACMPRVTRPVNHGDHVPPTPQFADGRAADPAGGYSVGGAPSAEGWRPHRELGEGWTAAIM